MSKPEQSPESIALTTTEIKNLGRLGKINAQRRQDSLFENPLIARAAGVCRLSRWTST